MNRDRQREIARLGGMAAHAKGTAHRFTSDEARAAGRKGGRAKHQLARDERRGRPVAITEQATIDAMVAVLREAGFAVRVHGRGVRASSSRGSR